MFDTGASGRIGPLLYLRGHAPGRLDLSALLIRPEGEDPGDMTTPDGDVRPQRLAALCGHVAWRYVFSLPARADAWYTLGGTRFPVDADLERDLRIAYVSCDGMEHGDEKRPPDERNLMWRQLAEQHRDRPFNLMLHGGDQIYADEAVEAHPASAEWPDKAPPEVDETTRAELRDALRDAYFKRYLFEFTQPEFAELAARVPSLAMWDDHDICNGWGSLAPEFLDSTVGRELFASAREFFLLFQLCATPDDLPEMCIDRSGESLTWMVSLPGVHILAPDLRSERRPRRVMAEQGWRALEDALARIDRGKVLLLSSVPALGPRLSVIERIMQVTPWLEKYESDLRDQWQSRRHRNEWRRFLRTLIRTHEQPGTGVTILSGEIHLATRATMKTAAGDLHQLIASGIGHPPPPGAWARTLGGLAWLGETPLKGNPISLHPLPGQRRVYASERNYLMLERSAGRWTARWDLEHSGVTDPLPIGGAVSGEPSPAREQAPRPAPAPVRRPTAASESPAAQPPA